MKRSFSRGGEGRFFASSRLVGFRRNGSGRRGATALKIVSLVALFAGALQTTASASSFGAAHTTDVSLSSHLTTGTTGKINSFNQCANGTNAAGPCNWINGDLNGQNSSYPEGSATVQFVDMTNLTPNTTNTVTLAYQTTKAGAHAYDFLTTWNFSEKFITDSAACQGVTGCTTGTVFNSPSTLAILPDPNANGHDVAAGTQYFTMMGGALTSMTTPTTSDSYLGDSVTSTTVSFTTPSSGPMCSGRTCEVVLLFGAHVASAADWNPGVGAASIPGSPYHVYITALNGSSIGNRDNQMQATAVTSQPGITLTKSANPTTYSASGQTITYTYTITNTGNTTLSAAQYQVSDNKINGGADFNCGSNQSLAVGATITCTSNYTTTTGDVSAGSVTNTAVATGGGLTSNTATATVTLVAVPTVTVSSPSPSPTLSTTPTVTGTTAVDSAIVTGNAGVPTGTVTFTLYSGTFPSGKLVSSYSPDTVRLSNGTASSAGTGNLPVGDYYFLVTYSGDHVYPAITDGTAEPFTINPQTATLATTPAETGLSATDSATLSGLFGTPTGTVTFTLFSGTPGSGHPVGSYAPDTVTLTSGGASSAPTSTLPSGNYYFMVTYSGDGTYSAITPGTAEAFTIIAVSPAPAPKKHKKPVVPTYKIPTKPPTTGFGGSARTVYNGGLLVGGSSVLVFGLLMMAYALRRRRRS